MREILFRGKRLDNGEWVYGYLVENESDIYRVYIVSAVRWETDEDGDTDVIETTLYEIDPATVGQFTGLTDKNGVKIFKGDILHVVTPNTRGNFQVNFGYGQFYIGINMPIAYVRHSCEVRGNIHDNPELLGGAK